MKNNFSQIKELSFFSYLSFSIFTFLFLFFQSNISYSQQYQIIPVTGFNQDLIAEGSGGSHRAFNTTTVSFDQDYASGGNHVMYAQNFRGDFNPSTAPPFGLANNGFIISANNTNIRYQLANYTGNNVIFLKDLNSTGTLTFSTSGCYSALSILAASAEGASSFTIRINFSDATYTDYSFTVADWFYGSNATIMGIGRVNRAPDPGGVDTYDTFDGDASNPRLYDCNLALSATDKAKLITGITATKTSSDGRTAILAVSGQANTNVPGTPTATAGTNVLSTSFTANWTAVDNVTSYKLDISTNENFSTFITGYNNQDVGNVITKSITGLTAGVQYFYRVRAANANGQSFSSNTISVGGISAPVSTDATNKTSTSFSANWGTVSGATSYRLDVATDFYFQSFVSGYENINVGNVSTYSVTGLTSGITYYFRVRAVNSSFTSLSSNIVSTGLPVPPVITYATNIAGTSFTANWAQVTATNYKIDVSTNSDFSSFVGSYNNYDMGNVTSFNVTGLTANTNYYYRVRSVNATGSSVNSNVVAITTVSYVVKITATAGTTGPTNYATLKAAFDAINAGTHQGVISIQICTNTSESASAVLNASSTGSAVYSSVTISPSGGARTISGSIAGALISLNGADYVTINGLNSGGCSLTIDNTSTSASASAILLSNSATYNIITNCTIKGSTGETTSCGVVTFQSGSNNYNTISYCNITQSGSNKPWACVVSGSGGTNYYNTIDHCNISNFKGHTDSGDKHSAIYLYYNTTSGWTITNNSIFQTQSITSSGGNVSIIYLSGGDGYTITGNYIGGSAANCGGSAMTYFGGVQNFYGIECTSAMTATNTNTICSNYFQNISFSTTNTTNCSNSCDPRFAMIHIWKGIFRLDSNTVGKTNTNGNISISHTSAFSIFSMFNIAYYNGANITSCSGNTFSGITYDASNYDAYILNFENCVNSTGPINNNLIGSTTQANSIYQNPYTASVTRSNFWAIKLYTNNTRATINGNTIQNITRGYGGSSNLYGIYCGYTFDVSNNTIKNIVSYNTGTLYNIYNTSSTSNFYGNSVTNISGGADVYGFSSTGSTPTIYNNYVSGLNTTSTSNTIYGMYIGGSTSQTVYNNIITLGYDKDGNNITNARVIGLYFNVGGYVYYNTVTVGGTNSSGSYNSYAYYQNTYGTATNVRNNIFNNLRSNFGASGKHYAASIPGNSSLTINYNNYYAPNNGGVIGIYASSDKSTLALWKSATGQDSNSLNTNPNFGNPYGTTAVNFIPGAYLPGTTLAGYTTDYSGITRSSTPSMGAVESYIWKGTTNNDFNTASNWLGGIIPPSGASVIFDPSPSNTCVLDQNRIVSSIVNTQPTYKLDLNGKNLTITGNIQLSNNAKIDAISVGSPTIIFAGSSAQTISSGVFVNDHVNNMIINNSAGVSLNGAITINNSLTLSSGCIILGSSDLTIGTGATISGTPSASNMIVTNSTGVLKKMISNAKSTFSFTFPIGDNSGTAEYSPVTLDFTSGNFSNAYVTAKTTNSKHPNNSSTTDYLNRYWDISSDGITGFSCDAVFNYVPADVIGTESNIYGGVYKSGWSLLNQVNPSSHNLSATLSEFASYTGGQQGVMPVSLQSFNSIVNGRDLKLNWVTSSEINNKGFDIERKTNSEDWKNIGFVQSRGAENSSANYSFADIKLTTGKYQYRLKQIDNNGNFSYYNLNGIIEIGIPGKYDLSQNYPNPFNPSTKIDYALPFDSKVNLVIYDLTGREVKKILNETKTAGYYTSEINMNNLASGVYIYRIVAESNAQKYSLSKKMVLVK